MSTQAQRKIGEHIRRIAGTAQPQLPIMSGVVKQVNEENGTCGVDLSVDDEDTTTSGIMINAVTNNNNGVLLIPAQNSNVWVAEIDGPGKWGIIKCSNVEKVIIKIAGTPEMEITSEHIKMNGGGNDGLVKVNYLYNRLQTLEQDIADLKTKLGTILGNLASAAALAGATTAPVFTSTLAAAFVPDLMPYTLTSVGVTQLSDLQNEKITH